MAKDEKIILIDIHGVIDVNPKLYRSLMKAWHSSTETKVYICTGPPGAKAKEELASLHILQNVHYTDILSVCDLLETLGVEKLPKSTPDNPWYPTDDWNRAKGLFCAAYKADLLIDDTEEYFKYVPKNVHCLLPIKS